MILRTILFLLFISFISCGSESTTNKGNDAVANVEEVEEVLENILPSYEDEAVEGDSKVVAEAKEVKQTVDNKTKYQVKPAEKSEESTRLAKEKVAKSKNSGKTCDQLITEFDALVNNLVSNPSESVVADFSKFIADPFHLNCKKIDEKYKIEIAKIEERLEDDDDDY